MRKLILTLAAGAAALAVASPAAAQYYPQPYGGYGYNNGYGYAQRNNYVSQSYGLRMRVDAIQRRIVELQRARLIRGDRAERLRQEARDIQRRLRGGYGFSGYAANDLQVRVARLEQRVNAAMSGRYGGYGYNNGYGYGQQNWATDDPRWVTRVDRRDRDRDDDRYGRDDD